MSRKARTRSLSKSLNEGMSPFGPSARFLIMFDKGNGEIRRPLIILQKIQAAIILSVVSENGVREELEES